MPRLLARVARFVQTPQAARRRALREPDEAPYGRDAKGRPDPGMDEEFAEHLDLEWKRRRDGKHIVKFGPLRSRVMGNHPAEKIPVGQRVPNQACPKCGSNRVVVATKVDRFIYLRCESCLEVWSEPRPMPGDPE